MLLSVVVSVEGDGQAVGPRGDVAAVVFSVEVDEVHAPIGQGTGFLDGGRPGHDVKDAPALVDQRVRGFESAAPGGHVGGVIRDLLGGSRVDDVDAIEGLGRLDAGAPYRPGRGSRPRP